MDFLANHFDAEMLARIQFAFTVSFHFIFPSFSIGLASYLMVLEALWLKTGKQAYLDLFNYWKKIFALAFGMGVVSGIVMSYQFGTNWSVFSDKAGPVIGPLMGYEVLTAFFLEAGFLGVMLFGMERVGKKLHMTATALVAIGTFISAFWILSVNSWMHTPQGFGYNEAGQFITESWLKVIFNPSFPYRLVHTVMGAYLTTAFIVGAVGAWHLLKGRKQEQVKIMFSMAMWMAAIVAPLQIVAGDLHGLNTLKHQPAKVAAMEGHFETQEGAPLILFGMPDMEEERTKWALEIPNIGSMILTHHWDGPESTVKGLKEWAREDRPNASLVFWSFRIMVGIGLLMMSLGMWSLWLRWRKRLYDTPMMHKAALMMGPSGTVAVIAGWFTTEVGRQPWTVYGLLRTSESLAPVEAPAVATSLVLFIIVYFAVFGAGTFYILRLMSRPPVRHETDLPDDPLMAGPLRAAGTMPAPAMEAEGDIVGGNVGVKKKTTQGTKMPQKKGRK